MQHIVFFGARTLDPLAMYSLVTPSFGQGCRKTEVFAMNTEDGIEVPESPLLRLEPKNRYGSVPGLDDEELADPEELERRVLRAEWGPALSLPWREPRCPIRPSVDMDGDLDWGAFATVDFDRRQPKRSWERSKVRELSEQLRDTCIMLSIIRDRLPRMAARQVVKWLRLGLLELEDIVNDDMRALAKLCMRAETLRKRIAGLQKRSQEREQRQLEAWLAALG